MRRALITTVVSIIAMPSGAAFAQWTYWDPASGGNGHYYIAVAEPSGINWDDAQAAAVAEGGHLATLTSADEDSFVFSLVSDPSFWSLAANGYYLGPWLGGIQAPGSPEPAGGWEWVTGEAFSYTNWASGQPNDLPSGGVTEQDRLHFANRYSIDERWNDIGNDEPVAIGAPITGYVIESLTPGLITLSVDIKPGSCPNPFNLKSRGKLPVALLGTEEFDVSAIDPASITLARADGVGGHVAPFDGPPGPSVTIEDVSTPFDGELCDCHEVEGDGIDDLSIKFSRPEAVTALELREFDPGATVELVVSGTLLDGTAFSGSDCILIVPQSDFDEDNDVDQSDFGHLQVCYRGPAKGVDLVCEDADIDGDGDVDISDFGGFQRCISGANKVVDPRCAD